VIRRLVNVIAGVLANAGARRAIQPCWRVVGFNRSGAALHPDKQARRLAVGEKYVRVHLSLVPGFLSGDVCRTG
jgi:hypothetical protein